MTNIDLSSLFNGSSLLLQTSFTPLQILSSLLITLVMVLFVHFIYRKTYSGVLYSKNFNLTLVMTALVVDAIMIGISGNIVLSLGLLGALSIIRFRTAVKDPKDTAFLFWAITIGVINGVAYYELSLIANLVIAAAVIVMSRKAADPEAYILILRYQANQYQSIKPKLDAYFKKYQVRSDSQKGELVEKVIETKIDQTQIDEALGDIRSNQFVESCVLVSSNGDFAE